MSKPVSAPAVGAKREECQTLLQEVSRLLEEGRRSAARSINAILTSTYWEIGRQIVQYEQRGAKRTAYGKALLKCLSPDLTKRFGRGFSERNLEPMRLFYLGWPISQTASAKFRPASIPRFPLSWSHYALGGLTNTVFASRYQLQLPDPKMLARELEAERHRLEQRLRVSAA